MTSTNVEPNSITPTNNDPIIIDGIDTSKLTRSTKEMQEIFLEALAGEANGNLRAAMRIAGYSEGYPTARLIQTLSKEIIRVGEQLLAAHTIKAALSLVDGMDNGAMPGTANKINAAKEILDRAGVSKKNDQSTPPSTQTIVLLPAKEKVSIEITSTPTPTIDITPNIP